MFKLGNQRKDLRPIDLLLRQLEQQSIREKQALVESQIDKQYEMLRAGQIEEMNKRTKMSQVKNTDTKNNITDEIKKKIDKKPPLTKLEQMKRDCDRGAMTACDYVKKQQSNKKKALPLSLDSKYTTPDLIIDYDKGKPFVKLNPVVKDLQDQQKIKDYKEYEEKYDDAIKLGKQDKEHFSKMYHPEKTIKMGYNTPVFLGSSTI